MRKLAVQQIAETDNPSVEALIQVLNGTIRLKDGVLETRNVEGELNVRLAAAEALGKIQDKSAIPYLAAALQIGSEDYKVPRALAKFPPEDVMPYIAAALKENYLRYNALATLSYLGTPEAVRLLLQHREHDDFLQNVPKDTLITEANTLLNSNDPVTQTLGARILGEFAGNDTPPETLLPLVDNPDAKVRKTALQALKNFKAPAATDALVRMLTTDAAFPLRAEAATALQSREWQPATPEEEAAYQVALLNFSVAGTLGEAAVPALKIAMTGEAPLGSYGRQDHEAAESTRRMRIEAVQTFGTAAPPSAALELASSLKDSNSDVRGAALQAIQKLNNPEAVPLVVPLLRDTVDNVRRQAAEALGSLGDTRATEPLCAALNDYEICDVVVVALGRIEDPAKFVPLADFVGNMNAHVEARGRALDLLLLAQKMAVAEHLEAAAKQIPDGLRMNTIINGNIVELRQGTEAVAAEIRKKAQAASETAPALPDAAASIPSSSTEPTVVVVQTFARPDGTQQEEAVPAVEIPATIDAQPAIVNQASPPAVAATSQEIQELLISLTGQLTDPDYWLRKVAAQKLGELALQHPEGTGTTVPNLIKALKDENEAVRIAAAKALGGIKSPAAIKHLVAGLRDPDGDVLSAMADALAQYEPALVMELLQLAASDEDERLRRGAASALQRIHTPESVQLLTSMLQAQPHYRAIKEALLAQPAELTKPVLLEALHSTNVDTACGAAEILGETGGEDVRQALLQTAQDPASPASYAAATALASFTDDATTQALITLLNDPDHHLRERAAAILATRGYKPATPEERARFYVASGRLEEATALGTAAEAPLVQLLKAPPLASKLPSWESQDNDRSNLNPLQVERERRNQSIHQLGMMKAESAVEPLIQLLSGNGKDQRRQAIGGLFMLGDDRAVAPLLALLDDPDTDIRGEAAHALSVFRSPEGIEARKTALRNLDVSVREITTDRLKELDWDQAKELYLLALQDDAASVRETAVNALSGKSEVAVPFLEAHFQELSPETKSLVVRFLPATSLSSLALQDTPEVKAAAVQALKEGNSQRPRSVAARPVARPRVIISHPPVVLESMRVSLSDAAISLSDRLSLAELLLGSGDSDSAAAASAWVGALGEAEIEELNKQDDSRERLRKIRQSIAESSQQATQPQ